jgi:Transposase DDE domain
VTEKSLYLWVCYANRLPVRDQSRFRESEVPRLEHGWRLVDQARECFGKHVPLDALDKSWQDPRRTFKAEDYLSLLLIGLFNPTVRTLRGLCSATHLPRLQRQWGCGSMSLGSTSEAQSLIDPELLRPLIAELSEQVLAQRQQAGAIPGGKDARLGLFDLRAIDSTVLSALPRMAWAVYGGGRPGFINNAVRFHLSFDPIATRPVEFFVSEGRQCERKVWKEHHQPAEPEVTSLGDRYYGQNFSLLEEIARKSGHFVVRLREHDPLEVVEEFPVSEADKAAGVVRQAWVLLGKRPRPNKKPIRIIWLQRPEKMIVLATDFDADRLPAELAAQMYRHRWQVEFFFRWVKCLLGCKHWMAESRQGVTLQLYLVLVAALLLQLRCGRRPTRRMMELLQFYFQGLASARDLSLGLEREREMAEAAAARQKIRHF